MLRVRKIRLFVAPFVLALLVAAAPAEAAGETGPGWAARLWSWLQAWSGSAVTFATGELDEGPAIDPMGGNRTTTTKPSSDSGPTIDSSSQSR
jgi:hypothetical protein